MSCWSALLRFVPEICDRATDALQFRRSLIIDLQLAPLDDIRESIRRYVLTPEVFARRVEQYFHHWAKKHQWTDAFLTEAELTNPPNVAPNVALGGADDVVWCRLGTDDCCCC